MPDVEVVLFTQETCSACTAQKERYGDVETAYPEVTFSEVDVQSDLETASEYGVRKTPTTLVIADGERIEEFLGVTPRSDLEATIERAQSAGGLVSTVTSFLRGE